MQCSGPSNSNCKECRKGTFLSATNDNESIAYCLTKCPAGYYPDSNLNKCQKCYLTCKTCRKGTKHDCTSCLDELIYYNSVCAPNCTLTEKGYVCISCLHSSNCKLCNATKCLECFVPYYLIKGECSGNCPDGTYKTINNDIYQCLICNSKCQTCYNNGPKSCIICQLGYTKATNDYCVPLVCKQNEYMLNYICFPCSIRCLTCYGPSEKQCLSCARTLISINSSNGINCFECSELYTGMYYDERMQNCNEICGDGLNIGLLECDDGNLQNKDGCSSKCNVEKGWVCHGGNSSTKDICNDITPPNLHAFLSNQSKTLTVVFSEQVSTLIKISPSELFEIYVKPSKAKKLCYINLSNNDAISPNNSFKKLILYTYPNCSLNGNEKVEIRMLNPSLIIDKGSNVLNASFTTMKSRKYNLVVSKSASKTTAVASKSSKVVFYIMIASSLIL